VTGVNQLFLAFAALAIGISVFYGVIFDGV